MTPKRQTHSHGKSRAGNGFSQRVQLLVDKYSESNAAEFSRQTGIPRRTVQKVLEGNITNPGLSFAARLMERFPAEDARWLLTGRATSRDAVREAARAEAARLLEQFVAELKGQPAE